MANTQAIQEALLRAVDTVVTQRINELKLDKTITAIVKKNKGLKNNKSIYQLWYMGGLFDAICQNKDDIYLPNTSVYVLIPQGDFSKEKIIIGSAESISAEKENMLEEKDLYAKLNANLLTFNNKEIYGLHSWHEDNNIYDNDITHRYQYIYQKDNLDNNIIFSQDILDNCKEEAIALMVRADFQTNLDEQQKNQLKAKYGLIFNFAFYNSNNGYGETNGEIFDNIAPIVKSKIKDKETQTYIEDRTLAYYNKAITEIWENNNYISNLIIDLYLSEIAELYTNFMVLNSELNTDLVNTVVNNFLILLNQLAKCSNISAQKEVYNNWRNIKVGESNYKYEQFILNSENMLGNPFSFNDWSDQYAIFPINPDKISHLDSIIFFQEGFNQNFDNEQIWPPSNPNGPDILMQNPQIYLLKNSVQKDEYTLKVEPYNNSDFIITKNSDLIEFKATFLRGYENLTLNNNTNFYWFKESSSIINTNKINYNPLAGLGWEELVFENSQEIFSTTSSNNKAFKNNYKCIAVYNSNIILEYNFSIYNKIVTSEIELKSDLGTHFTFDAGVPTISIRIKDLEKGETDFSEKGYSKNIVYPDYKYKWCLINSAGIKTFLNQNDDLENIASITAKNIIWNDIEEKILLSDGQIIDSFDSAYTTRILCPMSKINEKFSVMCYVMQRNKITDEYFDIGSAKLDFINTQNEINVADYRVQIINGDQNFKYDVYGKAPTDNSNKTPLKILPLQVRLLTLADVEIEPNNYEVEWIFPPEDTTLLIPVQELNEHLTIKARGCSFDIKKDYDANCYDNQIVCHIVFNNKHFYKNTKFYFGKEGNNGTNGTDVIAKIEYVKDDDYDNILKNEPVTLYTYKERNKLKSFINTDSRRTLSSNQVIFKDKNNNNDNFSSIFEVYLYQRSEKLEYTNSPKYSLAGNRDGNYFETGLNLLWNGDKFDEKLPLIQNIRTEIKLNDNETYYAFISLPIIHYETNPVNEKKLISIDKSYYLNEIVYNADGRNPIYNHHQGLRLNLPDNIDSVQYIAKGGFDKHWINSNEYISSESSACFNLLENEKDTSKNYIINKIGPDKNSIYVLPNDVYTGSITNNRIEAYCYEGNKLIATVYAPINMTLNTFGLASLNAWDGNSVTIDEEGGYIMAPQVGAGEKDSNNRFTGILMGKTETYTGKAEKEKQIGLFGYSCGLQSIFLDAETGNATFGLPEGYTIETRSGITVPVEKPDEYEEGRIEFRPGGESKIGGWKIGRRSLYYTMKPAPILNVQNNKEVIADYEKLGNNLYKYSYSGQIGPRYFQDEETPQNRQYAEHHIKDINLHDSGILLSSAPPYISVVGTMLTEEEIDNDSNGYLERGDSIEIQLDPQTPTVFTIFRHNSDFRKQEAQNNGVFLGDRTFLAGINAKGQLQANIIGSTSENNRQASMYFGLTGQGFEEAEAPNYMGAIFEAGTSNMVKPFMKLIVNKDELQDADIDTTYISVPGNLQIKYNNYEPADVLCIYEE